MNGMICLVLERTEIIVELIHKYVGSDFTSHIRSHSIGDCERIDNILHDICLSKALHEFPVTSASLSEVCAMYIVDSIAYSCLSLCQEIITMVGAIFCLRMFHLLSPFMPC